MKTTAPITMIAAMIHAMERPPAMESASSTAAEARLAWAATGLAASERAARAPIHLIIVVVLLSARQPREADAFERLLGNVRGNHGFPLRRAKPVSMRSEVRRMR